MVKTAPRYYSTRDAGQRRVSFQHALLAGLAPDGGLYIPDSIPSLSAEVFDAPTFADLGVRVLSHWLHDDIPERDLTPLVHDALNFPVPLAPLKDDVQVLELFHGPTLSFKDFAARTMARLMNYFLSKRNEKALILVATSGDTGSAVADGFAGLKNIEVVLLYPRGMVSDVQERQLIVRREGVRAYALEGTFDDCQRIVKEAFLDPELAHLPLSSANSINIGRLLPQSLYYLWAVKQAGFDKVNICVPSGNLGNLTGGLLAKRMGLAVNRFIVAHNANDFFPTYLQGGCEPFTFKPTVATVSNAMDVGAPSNFERLHALFGSELQSLIWGISISDEITEGRMKRTYDEDGYVACPHTAVGLEAVARYRAETGDLTPFISLATAHPGKFPHTVKKTLGLDVREEALERLFKEDADVVPLAPTLEALRAELLA